MKFVILTTSEFGLSVADAILDNGHSVVAMISMPKKFLPNNSVNVEQFAIQNNISYHEYQDINSKHSVSTIQNYDPDYIFSSWPKIIAKEVLDLSKFFSIGSHPTELPFNRGRHPLHWIINLGIQETHLSFFKIDEGIDTGDIILQHPVKVGKKDTIIELNHKINKAAYEASKILCKKLILEFNLSGKSQNHNIANYWRMRTPHDVTIDPRMPADLIINIVNSFTKPYPCANLIFKKYIIKIEKATIVKTAQSLIEVKRIEPGRLISIDANKITLKAADKIIVLSCLGSLPKEIKEADYIHPPSKYVMEYNVEIS